MSISTIKIDNSHLHAEITKTILRDLKKVVEEREDGHCIRVTDIPLELMRRICKGLRNTTKDCEAYVLSNSPKENWEISSTKLIELRNAGSSVIVIFIPPSHRTAAEDSFDVSTFERYPIKQSYSQLIDNLFSEVPEELVPEVKKIICESGCKDLDSKAKYLIAIRDSGFDHHSLGLALYHLGLVPDNNLPEELNDLSIQLNRNKKAVTTLSSPNSTILEDFQSNRLHEGNTQKNLLKLFNHVERPLPQIWLPLILDEPYVENLTFDKWEFLDQLKGKIEDMEITRLGTTGSFEGYPLFDPVDENDLKVTWETNPPPIKCEDLAYFSLELMRDDSPQSEHHVVRVTRSKNKSRSSRIKNIIALGLEKGLYYIRLRAWAVGDSLIKETESETFWIVEANISTSDIEFDTKDPRKEQKVNNIYESMIKAQVNLKTYDRSIINEQPEHSWSKASDKPSERFSDNFRVKYTSKNNFVLPINSVLRRIEIETLKDLTGLGRYEIDLRESLADPSQFVLRSTEGLNIEVLGELIETRRRLFNKITDLPLVQGTENLVETTTNLLNFEDAIIDYLEAFHDLLSRSKESVLSLNDNERRGYLINSFQSTSLDTIRILLDNDVNAYLIGPTHPLKMAWALQLARMTDNLLYRINDATNSQEQTRIFDDALSDINSLNIPHVLIDDKGDILVNVDSFGPFWSIFIPMDVKDQRSIIATIKTKLGSPEADERFTTITGKDLAKRVKRYIIQHPYVTTLIINAIQPGSGALLVDVLLTLQEVYPNLHYRINLFTRDDTYDGLGAALDDLLIFEEKRKGNEHLDAFAIASSNALFPKLVFSKHRLDDLLNNPNIFDAHISILFDTFNVVVEPSSIIKHDRSNHVFGLVCELINTYSSSEGETRWQRQVIPSHAKDIKDENIILNRFVDTHKVYNELVTLIATKGECQPGSIPTINLMLGPVDKNLISQVHQASDWVFTIDRNFGVEYLDNPYDENYPIYLIDQQPDQFSHIGHRFFISTQQIGEMNRIVQPQLETLELPSEDENAAAVIIALRSISSRLVLKLISSPQSSNGALGMALARLFLEQADLMGDMILIPLDSHKELFTMVKREKEKLGLEVSLRRTDMLLVEMDPKNRTLTFHLIEVKFRKDPSPSVLESLQAEIKEQLDDSEDALRQLYDIDLYETDRIDRELRTFELTKILKNYLNRTIRYGLISEDHEQGLRIFLNDLENGYSLKTTKSGIVLSLNTNSYEFDQETDVTYYYIGLDKIKGLISMATVAIEEGTEIEKDLDYTETRGTFTKRKVGENLDMGKKVEKFDEGEIVPSERVHDETEVKEPILSQKEGEEAPGMSTAGDDLEIKTIIGSTEVSQQVGVIGKVWGQKLGLDLDRPNSISIFGIQGSGKSYTLGAIIEMSLMSIPNLNNLPQPLATVVFHYSSTEDYKSEFTSIVSPNDGPETEDLREVYGVSPQGFNDVVILVSEDKVEQRKKEFPGFEIHPVLFDSKELDIDDWRFLMGAVGKDTDYIRIINNIIKRLHRQRRLDFINLYSSIVDDYLNDAQVNLANMRLKFAEEYLRDGYELGQHIKPGRLVIVDIRDPFIEQQQALGLFMVIQKIFSNVTLEGKAFNKLLVFDEAHKYMNTDFIEKVVETVRLMRHKGNTVIIASQDPKSVPIKLIELSSVVILHKMIAPNWLKHIKNGVAALKDLNPGDLNLLKTGQAYIWSNESNRHEFETKAIKVEIRPRVTKHGGETKKAVDN